MDIAKVSALLDAGFTLKQIAALEECFGDEFRTPETVTLPPPNPTEQITKGG
jgi:hypothetical protein